MKIYKILTLITTAAAFVGILVMRTDPRAASLLYFLLMSFQTLITLDLGCRLKAAEKDNKDRS